MAKRPDLRKCPRVLVVEGYSDLLFYAEVLESLGCLDGVFIKEMNGKEDLLAKLETFLSPGLLAEKESVGVIVDADDNPSGTMQAVADRLSKITGQQVGPGWTRGKPRLGLHVVPGASGGEVESLAWAAWANDPRNVGPRACVEGFLGCMRESGLVAKSPDKGRIGALLAVLYDEDPRLGPGARANAFDFRRPEFAPLCAFLRGL